MGIKTSPPNFLDHLTLVPSTSPTRRLLLTFQLAWTPPRGMNEEEPLSGRDGVGWDREPGSSSHLDRREIANLSANIGECVGNV